METCGRGDAKLDDAADRHLQVGCARRRRRVHASEDAAQLRHADVDAPRCAGRGHLEHVGRRAHSLVGDDVDVMLLAVDRRHLGLSTVVTGSHGLLDHGHTELPEDRPRRDRLER